VLTIDASVVDGANSDRPAAVDTLPISEDSNVLDGAVVTDASTLPDVVAVVDVPAVADTPRMIDVVAVTDVPVAADVPDVPDVPAVDAGPCPLGMIFIPAGAFMMGSNAGDPDELPIHQVTLSAYCIDVTEVTVAAYRACTAPGCSTPNVGGACNWGVAERDAHPINCVDWNQALAYCRWRGADLPTEAQWEYAARGSDGRTYPWGSATPSSQLCWAGAGSRTSTCPVGMFSSGNSPSGVMDMAGNVYEWTADWMGPYGSGAVSDPTGSASGTFRVFRGGGWGNSATLYMRSAGRDGQVPTYRDAIDGFRCARPSR